MAKAIKKAPVRKPAVKAKIAKRAGTKPVRRKSAPRKKAPSRLERVENAILATVAEVDELALDMGLLGATPPKKNRTKKARTKSR